ncbi:MAG: glutathione S-transferase family protein [Robiginitomaculum sp.]|nr:glutathione S-transferase family protein [Robiginitomaculum sp.]
MPKIIKSDFTVYHLPRSRSMRVLWLLEELNLPYTVETLDFIPGKFGGDDYSKVHPLNKVPAFKDGKMVMFESVAIMQYIMDKYGSANLVPNIKNPEYGSYLQWLHYGESSLAPVIATLMYQRHFFKPEQRSKNMDDWGQAELTKMFSLLENQLGAHDFILESGFSAADISVGYCLLLARLAKAHDQITDRIQEYWDCLTERDAWLKISKI